MTTADLRADDVAAGLETADREYREVEDRIEEYGESSVEAVADAYDRATTLLAGHEGSATGTGREEFKGFVKFKVELGSFVEGLDDDLPHREAFEAMQEDLDRRRVNREDFERAREKLAPAEGTAGLLDDREQALSEYRKAREAVADRIAELDAEADRLERVLELGEADLDAPVERIRGPIEAYNDAVRSAFRTYREEVPARELVAFVAATASYPLAALPYPPAELREYVEEYPAGEDPLPTLLEYAGYSRSKLSHYVEDPAELKRRVATQRTYLESLSADPLTVDWPPPESDELAFEARELAAICARFAPDEVAEHAHRIRRLAHEEEYDRLRRSAVAREHLDREDRERLASGEIEDELEGVRERREELAALLEEYPER